MCHKLKLLSFSKVPKGMFCNLLDIRDALHSFNLKIYMYKMCVCVKLLQSCLTLCDPMDCSPPGSSVHGILQARILEWVAISFFRGSSQPRDQTCISYVSCTGRWIFYHLHHLRSPNIYICVSFKCSQRRQNVFTSLLHFASIFLGVR